MHSLLSFLLAFIPGLCEQSGAHMEGGNSVNTIKTKEDNSPSHN